MTKTGNGIYDLHTPTNNIINELFEIKKISKLILI